MKRILYVILTVFALSSCNYLEFDETSKNYTKEDMYQYFSRAKQMLTTVYIYIPQDFGVVSKAMRACGSDDAEFGDVNGAVQRFNNGNWSANSTIDTQWKLYDGVRSANSFLESISVADFSRYENNPNYGNWLKQIELFPYEARVLRAYFFFELAKRYGDIAIPLTVLTTEEANQIGKTSFEDVIKFIVSECDIAAQILPNNYLNQPNKEFGRVTKGFAMALKTRALLYSSSPLHNSNRDSDRWVATAKAAQDIIDLGIFSLDTNSGVNDIDSPETIMLRMNSSNNIFELNNFPIRFTEGNRDFVSGVYPTQNLVDAFQTIRGVDVVLTDGGWESDDASFNPQRPFEGRDPRFARTVLANGMSFKGGLIQTFNGGRDDASVNDGGTPTGYFLRKYIQETTSFSPDSPVKNQHHWVVYRYAETLLTYAEAMVEAFGDPNYTDVTYKRSAAWALNSVRSNVGMPNVVVASKADFIEAVKRERRVEFAFEDHRFWDVRRWMDGATTQVDIYGVEIERSVEGALNFSRNLYKRRAWSEKMNLFPIPNSEIYSNPNLAPQNKGW